MDETYVNINLQIRVINTHDIILGGMKCEYN